MAGNQLGATEHIVVLMLENRSFDHMLGFLYADEANRFPAGDPWCCRRTPHAATVGAQGVCCLEAPRQGKDR